MSIFGEHAFGQHAFGMPMFSEPPIEMQEAGELGPHFDQRPTPAGFPGASVRGMGDCCGGSGLGAVSVPGAARYNAANCASLGWEGNVVRSADEPFLNWVQGRGNTSCGSPELVRSVEGFQTYAGLKVDGKLGPATLAKFAKPTLPTGSGGPMNSGAPGLTPTGRRWLLGAGILLLFVGGYTLFGRK